MEQPQRLGAFGRLQLAGFPFGITLLLGLSEQLADVLRRPHLSRELVVQRGDLALGLLQKAFPVGHRLLGGLDRLNTFFLFPDLRVEPGLEVLRTPLLGCAIVRLPEKGLPDRGLIEAPRRGLDFDPTRRTIPARSSLAGLDDGFDWNVRDAPPLIETAMPVAVPADHVQVQHRYASRARHKPAPMSEAPDGHSGRADGAGEMNPEAVVAYQERSFFQKRHGGAKIAGVDPEYLRIGSVLGQFANQFAAYLPIRRTAQHSHILPACAALRT